jgi:hypothetical protein
MASVVGCGTPQTTNTTSTGKADENGGLPETSQHFASVTACNKAYASSAMDDKADLQQYSCLVKANDTAVPLIEGDITAAGSKLVGMTKATVATYRNDVGALDDAGLIVTGLDAQQQPVLGVCAVLIGTQVKGTNISRPGQASRRCAVAAESNLAELIDEFVDFKTSPAIPSDDEINGWKMKHPACFAAYDQASSDNVTKAEQDLATCLEADYLKTRVPAEADATVQAAYKQGFADLQALCNVLVDASIAPQLAGVDVARGSCVDAGLSILDALATAIQG